MQRKDTHRPPLIYPRKDKTRIGYKLLRRDGTSLDGKIRYPLDGTWFEVPGDGACVSHGLHEGLFADGKPWDICVKLECREPTVVPLVRTVQRYRQIRVIRVSEKVVITCADGSREWWCAGDLHRDNGPAIVYPGGRREWWCHGVRQRVEVG